MMLWAFISSVPNPSPSLKGVEILLLTPISVGRPNVQSGTRQALTTDTCFAEFHSFSCLRLVVSMEDLKGGPKAAGDLNQHSRTLVMLFATISALCAATIAQSSTHKPN